MDSPTPGLPFAWDLGDKTVIQVDQSSVVADSTAIITSTLYRYLVNLEKTKKITKYDLSFSQVERKALSGSGEDGFQVIVKDPRKFVCVESRKEENKATKTNFFNGLFESVIASKVLQHTFRWRFERVNCCSKVQKLRF